VRNGRSRRFLLPVKALSSLFRAKFRDELKKHDCFQAGPAAVWSQDWVVHCQPVGRGQRALRYLAPYVFRVALTNWRLVAVTDKVVSFRFRPSGSRAWRLCTLSALEFIRRFLQHVLPKGFVKVRYYGFFSPGQRRVLRRIVAWFTPSQPVPSPTKPQESPMSSLPDWHPHCPHCGQPLRLTQKLLPAKRRARPP